MGLSDYLADLQNLVTLLENRGLRTRNTRIDRYVKYLELILIDGRADAAKIFKNAQDARFKSPMDWALYVMRETHELAWIAKGLQNHIPEGVDEKLRLIIAGRDFAALDRDSRSRDAQFELRIASYFCQSGCDVSLSATDVVVLADGCAAFFIECKRIGSASQLPKRLSEARNQLTSRMPSKIGKRRVYGCIAADVTKIAFTHNGITMGVTNEHSRDVIQKKLIAIAEGTKHLSLFKERNGLLDYWFQIHLPALILQPRTVATRFSSLHVARTPLDQKQLSALRLLYGMFESASRVADPRLRPSEPLRRRKSFDFPAGTTFTFSERLGEILARELTADDDGNEFIGELTINGSSHTFTLFDLRFMPTEVIQKCRDVLTENPARAGFLLLAEMFLWRFPFEG
jgi:hypothetical protein